MKAQKEEGNESEKIKQAIAILKPIADQKGVSCAELIEGYEGEESEESAPEDSEKVGLIVARLKGMKEGE